MSSDAHGETLLGDLYTLQRGQTYKSRLKGLPGPVLLGLASIQRNGGFRHDRLTTYGGSSPDALLVQPGDLFVSLKDVTQAGDLLGAVAQLPPSVSVGRLTQDTVRLVPKRPGIPSAYIYWLLRTPDVRSHYRSLATGTTNLGLGRGDFLGLGVPEYSPVRRHIVELLGYIEDKIELNRRMNHTLEEMASALFRSWFINFDPVEAKADGRAPFGMDAETAALFPDAFVDSEEGPIPEGWAVRPIGDVIEAAGGSTPSTKESAYWEGGAIAWCTPKDLSGVSVPVILETAKRITPAGLAKISSGLLPKRTVLLSSRAPIGYTAITEIPLAINQGFIAMRPTVDLDEHYLLHWTRANMDEIKSRAGGTTFAEISKRAYRPIPILVPSRDVVRAFHMRATRWHEALVANEQQSRTLAALRDALLPQLLSGTIRLSDAERQVGEA